MGDARICMQAALSRTQRHEEHDFRVIWAALILPLYFKMRHFAVPHDSRGDSFISNAESTLKCKYQASRFARCRARDEIR